MTIHHEESIGVAGLTIHILSFTEFPCRDLEQLGVFALSFHNATEDIKWGVDLCFCIAGKMFFVTGLDQPFFMALFKVKDKEFEELSGRPGIKSASYVAKHKGLLSK